MLCRYEPKVYGNLPTESDTMFEYTLANMTDFDIFSPFSGTQVYCLYFVLIFFNFNHLSVLALVSCNLKAFFYFL